MGVVTTRREQRSEAGLVGEPPHADGVLHRLPLAHLRAANDDAARKRGRSECPFHCRYRLWLVIPRSAASGSEGRDMRTVPISRGLEGVR